MNILIAEDQPQMKNFLVNGLNEAGYKASGVETSRETVELANQSSPDLIVLDVMLPDETGFMTAKKLRSQGYKGSILMLTALDSTRDKIDGLDAGADDYLTKPFEINELLARIRALGRRQAAQRGQATTLQYAGVEMDLITRKVTRAGKPIDLTQKEFSLLELLLRNKEKTVERSLISTLIWETEYNPESNVIDVCVNTLRKKLDQGFEKKLVHTAVGVGYVLRETF